MSAEKNAKPPIPRWAWIFAAVCMVIPITTIGGAIPTAIGAFSALGVMGIARQTDKPTRKKVIYCGVVTGSAWTVFVVFLFALTALQAKHPQLNQARNKNLQAKQTPVEKSEPKATYAGHTVTKAEPPAEPAEMTLEKKQDIYRMAVRICYHIDSAIEQRAKLKAKGFDVSARDDMIARLKEREQDHFEFVMKFHKLDRAELDEIIYEGDRNNWPTGSS